MLEYSDNSIFHINQTFSVPRLSKEKVIGVATVAADIDGVKLHFVGRFVCVCAYMRVGQ